MKTGRIAVNGVEVSIGDIVHCWDGDKDQFDVSASLRGVVNVMIIESVDVACVGDNELALYCCEHVEIIS